MCVNALGGAAAVRALRPRPYAASEDDALSAPHPLRSLRSLRAAQARAPEPRERGSVAGVPFQGDASPCAVSFAPLGNGYPHPLAPEVSVSPTSEGDAPSAPLFDVRTEARPSSHFPFRKVAATAAPPSSGLRNTFRTTFISKIDQVEETTM